MKQVADQLKGVRVLVAVAVFAALAIAGCGGSSDATGDGTTGSTDHSTNSADAGGTLTKALIIKKGDAICAKTDDIQMEGLEAFERKNP